MEAIVNILYTCADNYAHITGVSMLSLFENNKNIDEINVYLIGDGISEQNKQRLMETSEKYGRKLVIIDALDIEKIVGTEIRMKKMRHPIAIFYKLFISSIIPADAEKIIYLDCDTIIRSSLKEMWDSAVGDRYVLSGVVAQMERPCWRLWHKWSIMLRKKDIYIGSGIMLYNMVLWRRYGVEDKYAKYMHLYKGKNITEEGVFNYALKGHMGTLDRTYNCAASYARIEGNPEPSHNVPPNEIVDDPIIVHYIGGILGFIQEWSAGRKTRLCDIWLKYWEMSPWKNEPLTKGQSNTATQIEPEKKKARKAILNAAEKKCKPLFLLLTRSSVIAREMVFCIKKLYHFIRRITWLVYRLAVSGIKPKDCRLSL